MQVPVFHQLLDFVETDLPGVGQESDEKSREISNNKINSKKKKFAKLLLPTPRSSAEYTAEHLILVILKATYFPKRFADAEASGISASEYEMNKIIIKRGVSLPGAKDEDFFGIADIDLPPSYRINKLRLLLLLLKLVIPLEIISGEASRGLKEKYNVGTRLLIHLERKGPLDAMFEKRMQKVSSSILLLLLFF